MGAITRKTPKSALDVFNQMESAIKPLLDYHNQYSGRGLTNSRLAQEELKKAIYHYSATKPTKEQVERIVGLLDRPAPTPRPSEGEVTRKSEYPPKPIPGMTLDGIAKNTVEPVPTKRFHRSDSLTYEYNTIALTQRLSEGYTEGLHPDPQHIDRRSVNIHAAAHVSWQGIVLEWEYISQRKDHPQGDNPIMESVLLDTPDFAVALTLRGFTKLVETMPSYGRSDYEYNVELVAKELIAQRDYTEYCKRTPYNQQTKKFRDFMPKD